VPGERGKKEHENWPPQSDSLGCWGGERNPTPFRPHVQLTTMLTGPTKQKKVGQGKRFAGGGNIRRRALTSPPEKPVRGIKGEVRGGEGKKNLQKCHSQKTPSKGGNT